MASAPETTDSSCVPSDSGRPVVKVRDQSDAVSVELVCEAGYCKGHFRRRNGDLIPTKKGRREAFRQPSQREFGDALEKRAPAFSLRRITPGMQEEAFHFKPRPACFSLKRGDIVRAV